MMRKMEPVTARARLIGRVRVSSPHLIQPWGVAQLAERLGRTKKVTGSNPVSPFQPPSGSPQRVRCM